MGDIKPGFYSDAVVRDLPRAELVARHLPLRWHGQFETDLSVASSVAGEFNVPAGFITDGASIPRELWAALSNTDPDILYPSYAHDLIYSLRGALPGRLALTIAQADEVIRELMLAIGAPVWKAQMVFYCLRGHNGNEWKGATPEKRATIKLTRVKR